MAQVQTFPKARRIGVSHGRIKLAVLAGVAVLFVVTISPTVYSRMNIDAEIGTLSAERADSIFTTRSWFVAVNHYLATGDGDSLKGLLSGNFVDRTPLPGESATGVGMLASLELLRQQFQNLQLDITIIGIDGDRVVVDVRALSGGQPLRVPSAHADSPATDWTYTEQLRVVDGKVAERWGSVPPFQLQRSATSLSVSLQPLLTLANVSRLKISAGQLLAPGSMLLVIESGQARFLCKGGFYFVRNGERSAGLPNLITDVVAEAGDIVFAQESFVIETTLPASLLVLDIKRSHSDVAAMNPSESPDFNAVRALELSRMFPFTWLTPANNPALTAMSRVNSNDVTSVIRRTFSVPSGEFLPPSTDAGLVIVKLVSGAILNINDDSILLPGESLVLPPDLAAGALLVTEDALVEVVTVSFREAA